MSPRRQQTMPRRNTAGREDAGESRQGDGFRDQRQNGLAEHISGDTGEYLGSPRWNAYHVDGYGGFGGSANAGLGGYG
jgi:hypothetical protein